MVKNRSNRFEAKFEGAPEAAVPAPLDPSPARVHVPLGCGSAFRRASKGLEPLVRLRRQEVHGRYEEPLPLPGIPRDRNLEICLEIYRDDIKKKKKQQQK